MRKRNLIIQSALLPVAFLSVNSFSQEASTVRLDQDKPNFIIILADDLGYGDVGFNGCKDIPTPALDGMASRGVRFSNGYVTCPQCAPSRAGLLSGRYQNSFSREVNPQLDDYGIPEGLKLFGDYMKKAGYTTGMVGKWHLGTMDGCHPMDRGFDSFFGFLGGGSFYFPNKGQKTIPKILDGREPATVRSYLTHVFGNEAVKFIQENKEKPFFLYLSFNAPHTPLQAPEPFLAKFSHIQDSTRRTYAAMVSAMDMNITKVLGALNRNGLTENTIVFFLSDNGGPTSVTRADNKPFRGVKGDILEGGVHVPFIMQWKGTVKPRQVIETPVSALDLIPTALAAAGVKPGKKDKLDGQNLLPLVRGKSTEIDRSMFWRFPHPWDNQVWGVRTGDWKLVKEAERKGGIGQFTGKTKTGLYNLKEDISESNDLSESNPEKRKELQSVYDKWAEGLPITENYRKKK